MVLGQYWLLNVRCTWQYNPQGRLPPQIWDKQYDETLPTIALTHTQSQWTTKRRIGASASFAFGGNNTVLIIGE